MAYVTVSSEKFFNTLTEAGFSKEKTGNEVVFERTHSYLKDLRIRIFTSVRSGGSVARAKGEDAIRVVLVLDQEGKTRCVKKAKRVYRTGTEDGVIERTLERAREMYKLANQASHEKRCACGAPRYPFTKKCMAFCKKE